MINQSELKQKLNNSFGLHVKKKINKKNSPFVPINNT